MDIQQIYLGSNKVGDLLRERLELDDDVVKRLLEADDWTMMILAWALVEACINQSVSARLGEQSLSSFVERLNIGGRSGKAELALGLGLLDKADRKFLDVFSEVRNRFAHGIKRFKTTFNDYFDGVDDISKYEKALPIKELPGLEGEPPTTFADNKRALILLNVISLCLKLTNSRSNRGQTTLNLQ